MKTITTSVVDNNNTNLNHNIYIQVMHIYLHVSHSNNRPIRLTQCCTQFKSLGVKDLCMLHLHDNVAFIWKYLEQNVLFPKDLNWVQH